LQRIHSDDLAGFTERLRDMVQERVDLDMELRIVRPQGPERNVHVLGHPVLSPASDLVECTGTVIDVTERKRAGDVVRQAQEDLAYVSRVTTMGELTASLAHELNQPIAAAGTNAKACLRWLARDEPDVAEARAAVSRIVEDCTRAADIISRIRMQFTKSTPQREWVDVNELIREMIVLLRNEADRYSISVRTELAPDLPRAIADSVQLQQVFMNLMLNGIHAMKDVQPARELTIRSRFEADQLVMSVSDTGMGLPSHADKIFAAFFTTKPGGIGMGLTISRSIIQSHGGRLWGTPNAGRGATFYFILPAKL
jgi:C4-dicarboxylate-specific signal transduction histidine kinase